MEGNVTTRYFRTFADDFVYSANQSFELPEGYRYLDSSRLEAATRCALRVLAWPLARLWLAARLGWRVENRRLLRGVEGGAVVFCNHTQPVGDALAPLAVSFPRPAYVVASPANLGIPVLGRLLPQLGALPLPDTLAGMKRFREAVTERLAQGALVFVYPEAHVWPWCTDIRPLPDASFAFAVDNHVPAFSLTTTYQPRNRSERPRATAIIDGPFRPEAGLSRKQARVQLRNEVQRCMRFRARSRSTCEYVRYEPLVETSQGETGTQGGRPARPSSAQLRPTSRQGARGGREERERQAIA